MANPVHDFNSPWEEFLNGVWDNNAIQFPRLLAEINAVGLTRKQYKDLEKSMDLTRHEIEEILDRAEKEWDKFKKTIL